MSLVTPSINTVSDNIISQLEASLNQTIPLLPKSFMRVLAKVIAAVFILLYKYGGFIFLQMFVETATIEDVEILGTTVSPLKTWGRLIGAGDPTDATQAELNIDIPVINQTGTLLSGTLLVSNTTGVTYSLVNDVLLDAATVSGLARAVADQSGGDGSGTVGNLNSGDVVSFTNPIAEIERDATVDAVTPVASAGVDAETEDAYRKRVIDRFQNRPQGGALLDYKIWGLDAANIANIYPYTGAAAGEVDVYVEASDTLDGIPTAGELADVLDKMQFDPVTGQQNRRPANAAVNTLAITRTGFTVTVDTLVVDASIEAQVKADIESDLTAFFLAREPYISGVTIPPKTDFVTQTAIIGLIEDIVTAANGRFSTATFTPTTAPGEYELGEGEKAKLIPPPVYI